MYFLVLKVAGNERGANNNFLMIQPANRGHNYTGRMTTLAMTTRDKEELILC